MERTGENERKKREPKRANRIPVENMVSAILAADPEFAILDEGLERDGTDGRAADAYPLFLQIVHHMAGQIEEGGTQRLASVFSLLEKWLTHGYFDVRETATTGSVESLQDVARHPDGTTRLDFEPWLGPASRNAWSDVDRFWNEGVLMPDD